MATVLLVDDEPTIVRSTQILLEDMGFSVVATRDHKRVVGLARSHLPDVILQDVRMPGLNVEALIKDLRADPLVGKIPVLLFSASLDLAEVHARVGSDGFVEKPFRADEFATALRRITHVEREIAAA